MQTNDMDTDIRADRPTEGAGARRRRRVGGATLAVALLVGGAGCGGDEPDAAAPSTSSTASTASTPDAPTTDGPTTVATGDLAAYCDATVALDQVFQATDPSDPAAFGAALDQAAPIVEDLEANAPAELADAAAVLVDAFAQVRASGDPSAFGSAEAEEADATAHAFDLAHCDLTEVAVTATEYHFAGDLPTEPGRVSIEVTNEGSEPHLLIVARKHDDVAGSARDAFSAIEGEEDFPASFDQVVSVYADAGGSEYGLGELTPGEYVVFCPLPVGSSDQGEGDGPPHFVEGMVEDFTIA